jgi:hypothetical protein
MKRIILVFGLVFLIGWKVDAQDPTVSIILKQIEILQAKNVALQASVQGMMAKDLAQKAITFSTDAIQTLESLGRINKLLQSFYCQTSQTTYLITMGGTNCLIDMDVELALLNITYSQDIMKTIFLMTSTYFIMEATATDRMAKLTDLIDAMEKSMRAFNKLNQSLSLRLDQALLSKMIVKAERAGAKGMARNRYNATNNIGN